MWNRNTFFCTFNLTYVMLNVMILQYLSIYQDKKESGNVKNDITLWMVL